MIRTAILSGLALLAPIGAAAQAPAAVPVVTIAAPPAAPVTIAAVRTPPQRVVHRGFGPAGFHSGYYRYDSPVDQSRAIANGETNRYAPEMAWIDKWGQLHVACEPDVGGSRPAYLASVEAARKAAHVRLAALRVNGNTPAQITAQEGKVGLFEGKNLAALTTGIRYRCGLWASDAPLLRNGQMVSWKVVWTSTVRGDWPALWGFDVLAQMELDVLEGNWKRQFRGTRQPAYGLGKGVTPVAQAPAPPKSYTVALWIDGGTLRYYIDGKLWAEMPSGAHIKGAYNIYANMAMGSPGWSFIGMPDAKLARRHEFVVSDFVVTGP